MVESKKKDQKTKGKLDNRGGLLYLSNLLGHYKIYRGYKTKEEPKTHQEDTAGIFDLPNTHTQLQSLTPKEIAQVLKATVRRMGRTIRRDEQKIIDNASERNKYYKDIVGSTFVGSLVYNGQIYIASLGDSSAFLVDKTGEEDNKEKSPYTAKRLNPWDKLYEGGKPNTKEIQRVLASSKDTFIYIRACSGQNNKGYPKRLTPISKYTIATTPPFALTITEAGKAYSYVDEYYRDNQHGSNSRAIKFFSIYGYFRGNVYKFFVNYPQCLETKEIRRWAIDENTSVLMG